MYNASSQESNQQESGFEYSGAERPTHRIPVPKIDAIPIKIQKDPYTIMGMFKVVREKFRHALQQSGDKKLLVQNIHEEMSRVEKEATRNGVDFSRCQMDRYVAASRAGKPVEFESLSPYLSDYNMSTGEIWRNNLTNTDKVGVAVAKSVRALFSNARMISLYDEYNSDIPFSSDAYGKPLRHATDEEGNILKDEKGNALDAPQLTFDPVVRENFRKSLENLFIEEGIIDPEKDRDGEAYLLVSESSKVRDAELLVQELEAKHADLIRRDGQAIYFVNPNAENPLYAEIPMRTVNGRWLCEALDASSYLKPENLEITHLVILPNHFKPQQDKVWEILRVLGIPSTNYHNIFYDEKVAPDVVARTIEEEIEKYQTAVV